MTLHMMMIMMRKHDENKDELFDNAIELPIDGVLDLHTFSPRDVKDLLSEYISACREKGIFDIRIIH